MTWRELEKKMRDFGFGYDDVWDDETQIRVEGTPEDWVNLLSLARSEVRKETLEEVKERFDEHWFVSEWVDEKLDELEEKE